MIFHNSKIKTKFKMKKLFSTLFTLAVLSLLGTTSYGQIRTPAPSSSSTIEQTVGLTDVTINYSRPSVKGRTIFAADGLVPYGKMWRLGANAATKITFSDDVQFGGKDLKAGSYAVLANPTASNWTLYLYPYESGNWSSYTEKEPAAKVLAVTDAIPFSVETFSIGFNNITATSADLMFYWDKTIAAVPLTVDVDTKVMADIKRVMNGPSQNDYYAAATYYHESGKDLKQALEYIQKATNTDEPRFWQVRREALILADLGYKDDAIKAAKKSMKLAEEAGNDDYVRMNKKSIAEWMK